MTTAALQRGRDPGPHQRRLPACPTARPPPASPRPQPSQAGLDLTVPAEEARRCRRRRRAPAHGTGQTALGLGQGRGDHQRGVVTQDRLLQGRRSPDRDRRPARRSSTVRTWCSVRNASPWRPAWYCARASSAHRRSRIGASPTRACASASTSRWRPARKQASRRISSASKRQLIQPTCLDPTGLPTLELLQRRPPPQRQRLPTHVGRPVVLTQGQQLPSRAAPAARSDAHRPRPAASSAGTLQATSRSPPPPTPCAAGRCNPARSCATSGAPSGHTASSNRSTLTTWPSCTTSA